MKIKALIPLIAGLGIGGFALKMGIDTLQKAKAAPAATTKIWAASVDVPRGTKITEQMLTMVAFPSKLVPKGALSDKGKLLGRVPRVDAPAGLPFLDTMLWPEGDPGGVHVPSGLRAVAVKIDESSGVDFHLEPGSHVDVVGYFKMRGGGRDETIARTIIENVEVAAVGARISAVAGETEEKGTRPTRAVTLLVRPEKVPTLHLAEQLGKIKLSMRGQEDASTGGTSRAVREQEIFSGVTPAADDQNQAQNPGQAENGGIFGWFSELFVRPTSQPAGSAASVAAEPTAEPASPREPEWVVYVWRGDKVEVVRFRSRDSRERVGDDAPAAPARGAGAWLGAHSAAVNSAATDSPAGQSQHTQEPME